jgi:hypothetical protein
MLSAKSSSPAERRREAFSESLLSGKVSPRGKTPSARVSSLSVKGPNPVVVAVVALDGQESSGNQEFRYLLICTINEEDMHTRTRLTTSPVYYYSFGHHTYRFLLFLSM